MTTHLSRDYPGHTTTNRPPRWLLAVSVVLVGLLLAMVLLLVLGFVTAGPEDNLAGVLLVLAAVLGVPALISLVFWIAGYALRRRSPELALGLVILSTVVGGLGVLLVASYFLAALVA